jgi:hypothetical protein
VKIVFFSGLLLSVKQLNSIFSYQNGFFTYYFSTFWSRLHFTISHAHSEFKTKLSFTPKQCIYDLRIEK